jgi:hypothetical protein
MTPVTGPQSEALPQRRVMALISRRFWLGCAAALAFGLLLPVAPWDAVAWLILLTTAFAAPVGTVGLLVAITVLVPWDLQAAFKVIGGPDQPGLLFVDVLMLLGLVRIGWLLERRRLAFDTPLLVGTVVAALCTGALLWGVGTGANISEAGHEWRRVTLGVGTFLLAWPLMAVPTARRRLVWVLIGVGLTLGLWGIAQWAFSVGYTTSGDMGVRDGLGSGQLQGGLYAYPVAVAMAWAALVSGQLRSAAARWLLAGVLLVNAICVLLTFERTLLLASVLACVFVTVVLGPAARPRAYKMAGVAAVLLTVGAVVAQAEASTVTGRLALLGELDSDHSFIHRVVETQILNAEILARPITGSGFGATVTWGVPNVYQVSTTPFADMGYHWLFWKVGIPTGLLIVGALIRAVLRRSRAEESECWRVVRTGSRAALFALLIIGVLFGVFNSLLITSVMGVLVAICYSPALTPGSASVGASCPATEAEAIEFPAPQERLR